MDLANMDRWIKASFAKHFSDTLTKHLHVDGKIRETEELTEWYELRVWRIKKTERTKDFWLVEIWVDVACMAMHDTNAYDLNDLVGEVEAAMVSAIPLYTYSKTGSASKLACLERREDPESVYLGEINSNLKLFQTNVSCKYEVTL